jgi:hypothetical protein
LAVSIRTAYRCFGIVVFAREQCHAPQRRLTLE